MGWSLCCVANVQHSHISAALTRGDRSLSHDWPQGTARTRAVWTLSAHTADPHNTLQAVGEEHNIIWRLYYYMTALRAMCNTPSGGGRSMKRSCMFSETLHLKGLWEFLSDLEKVFLLIVVHTLNEIISANIGYSFMLLLSFLIRLSRTGLIYWRLRLREFCLVDEHQQDITRIH